MRLKLSVLFGGIFFVFALITLPDYGINWDTINHLPRGQVYLHYFLTGKKDFSDIPQFHRYWQKADTLAFTPDEPKSENPRVSFYQFSGVDFNYFMPRDGNGHPPLSDILSSVFNVILFQKLDLINDIDSYHVYGILLASLLAGLVYYWTAKEFGSVGGLIAVLALATYPLLWSESHFNTEKDIPETVYWSFVLFSFYRGVKNKNLRWLIACGVFLGLALGTKFNVLFVPAVLLPWLVFYWTKQKSVFKNKAITFSLFSIPLIGFLIFFFTWPYLWSDPIAHLKTVLGFYNDIGIESNPNVRYLGPFSINLYPLIWIFYTTPLVTLFLFIVGLLVLTYKLVKDKKDSAVLFLLWFALPIARVTFPNTSVYGGIRQIMEYIPAMAIIAGAGGSLVISWLIGKLPRKSFRGVAFFLIVLIFIPIIFKLIQIHPNENVYFNSLAGGLSGARKQHLPYAGNSFGAAYREGVNWINEHAQIGANIVYAYELIPNVPQIWYRRDLNIHNSNRSGYLRRGEYAITLEYEGTENRSYYDNYLEEFIEPVYQVKVNNVSILKVWENDNAHLKRSVTEELVSSPIIEKTDFGLRVDLAIITSLSRLEIDYSDRSCQPLASGYVQISKDGSNWEKLPGTLPVDWRVSALGEQPKGGKFIEPFVGQEVRYINLILTPFNTCLKQVKSVRAFSFK